MTSGAKCGNFEILKLKIAIFVNFETGICLFEKMLGIKN